MASYKCPPGKVHHYKKKTCRKRCKQARSRKTGKCIKRCKKSQRRNPSTGRCVKK